MDSGAISELFERHGGAVFRRCRQMLGNDAAAQDAVQEVFLRALARPDQLRSASSAFGWLYASATNHCLQQLRNERRRTGKLAVAANSSATAPGPDEALRARVLLEEFPEDVQQVAYLRHIDGMKLDEIAELTGQSTKTVARKLERFVAASRLELGAAQEIEK